MVSPPARNTAKCEPFRFTRDPLTTPTAAAADTTTASATAANCPLPPMVTALPVPVIVTTSLEPTMFR